MKRSTKISLAVTSFLLVYTIMCRLDVPVEVLSIMYLLSPFVVIWMALVVLKDNSSPVKELEKNEEWGYQDKNKNSLHTF